MDGAAPGCPNGHAAVVKLLLEGGANPKSVDLEKIEMWSTQTWQAGFDAAVQMIREWQTGRSTPTLNLK